jgi:predicted Zn-dependent protease
MQPEAATFYDGASARAWTVRLRFADAIEILADETPLARWPYDEIRRREAPGGMMRLGALSGPELARLEIADPDVANEILARCPALDHGQDARGNTLKIVGWSLAAAVSLVLTAIYLVPVAADRLADFIPESMERRLGVAVDNQVRAVFGEKVCAAPEGVAALDKLTRRVVEAGKGPAVVPAVLRSPIPNALALPGGRIYLLAGMLRRAENPDEIAGVLAHEVGHVAERDSLRRLLQTGGTSFLLGLLFGDVTGGAAIVIASRTLMDNAYSRDVERRADQFASDAMLALGRSPQPMAFLLRRVEGKVGGSIPSVLSTHPLTEERLQSLGSRTVTNPGPPLLTDEEWKALKDICRGE